MAGKLIVFEGVEGGGKSSQIQHLQAWLQTHSGFCALQTQGEISQVLLTREPGGTDLGQTLRALLLDAAQGGVMHDRTELLLYAADRAQHVAESLQPALAEGCWILCDRFVDSTLAYQGYGRGLSLDLIQQLNRIATGGLQADLTLWLKLDVRLGLQRSQRRGALDRMEQADLAFHQRVQAGFEALAQMQPERMIAVNAEATEAEVAHQIQRIVESQLAAWYPSLPVS
ncbi:MAG: dTMP kinase [Leptolyngbya sp. RL_3_1]|nr:dTMP kinase [Leptolyngbya sp. RL_3_1]